MHAAIKFRYSVRTALLLLALVPLALAVLVWLGPEISLRIAFVAMFLAGVAVLSLAYIELDRDVVHTATLLAAVGAVLGSLSERPSPFAGAAFGAMVGALLGDAIRDARATKLAGRAQAGPGWWRFNPPEPVWLARVTWSAALVAVVLIAVLVILSSSHGLLFNVHSQLWADLFDQLRAARTNSTIGSTLLGAWHIIALLVIALVQSGRVHSAANQERADRLLRRVAVLHGLALLLLAAHACWSYSMILKWASGIYEDVIGRSAELLRNVQLPLLLMLIAMLLMGKQFTRYIRRYGWMPALGFVGLAAAACVGIHIGYCLQPNLF